MTDVKALEAVQSSQGTSEPITPWLTIVEVTRSIPPSYPLCYYTLITVANVIIIPHRFQCLHLVPDQSLRHKIDISHNTRWPDGTYLIFNTSVEKGHTWPTLKRNTSRDVRGHVTSTFGDYIRILGGPKARHASMFDKFSWCSKPDVHVALWSLGGFNHIWIMQWSDLRRLQGFSGNWRMNNLCTKHVCIFWGVSLDI